MHLGQIGFTGEAGEELEMEDGGGKGGDLSLLCVNTCNSHKCLVVFGEAIAVVAST